MKTNKMKKMLSAILCIVMMCCMLPSWVANAASSGTDETITVIACSDFQNPSGHEAGKQVVKNILSAMAANGITSADGFFCCGDYDYNFPTSSVDGVEALKDAVKDVVTENMVFVQGNHDSAIGTAGMSLSGNNDPDNGAYGVFVINEDDYMWYNNSETTIKYTAQNLINYLNDKLEEGYDKPVFVLSHLPLHYSMRTRNDGDGQYANYIFDALNEAGEKGLNIIFMSGHDHSNGWDDYLGGGAYYLKKGDQIKIAQMSKTEFKEETLNFTYMNAGYVGYYRNVNSGADTTLTMTAFHITDDSVVVERYNENGIYDLKSKGVANDYKNESAYYSPNEDVYTSPQTVELTKVTDSSAIEDLIVIQKDGKKYDRLTDISQLKDGGQYLLIYQDYIMLPESVEKANSSGSIRVGFDLEKTTAFGGTVAYGDYTEKEWTLVKSENGWFLSDGEKYAKLTSTSSKGIAATLEETGDEFTIGGSMNAYTFTSGSYVLNYNSRGVINGYHTQPAAFSIYVCEEAEVHAHNLTLVGSKDASCTEPGNSAYYVCDECGKWFTDSSAENEILDQESVVISALGHDWAEATCTTAKTCKRCDATEGVPNGHTGSEWKYDEDNHWKECTVAGCEAVIESSQAAHEYGDDTVCDICGYVMEVPSEGDDKEEVGDKDYADDKEEVGDKDYADDKEEVGDKDDADVKEEAGNKDNTENKDNTDNKDNGVATGDNNDIFVCAAMMLASSMVAVSFYNRRREDSLKK